MPTDGPIDPGGPGHDSRKVVLPFSPAPSTLRHVTHDDLQTLIEDATADFALGDSAAAVAKLTRATESAPDSFEAWHALAEVNFSLRQLDAALTAGERAHRLRPDDLFINTTLSRIWMERGDKARAEHFGAQAKIQSWKEQLKSPPADSAPSL
jgi:Flp pilus assembly protein TadD